MFYLTHSMPSFIVMFKLCSISYHVLHHRHNHIDTVALHNFAIKAHSSRHRLIFRFSWGDEWTDFPILFFFSFSDSFFYIFSASFHFMDLFLYEYLFFFISPWNYSLFNSITFNTFEIICNYGWSRFEQIQFLLLHEFSCQLFIFRIFLSFFLFLSTEICILRFYMCAIFIYV